MSRFFSSRYAALTPYVPGEQPRDRKYIKLNTNESPYAPPRPVADAAGDASAECRLYSDPESTELREALAARYGLSTEQVIVGNGSDEILNFSFMAFGDETHPLLFPDITYGFYPVFAKLNRIPYREIPLEEDFTIDLRRYEGHEGVVVIANPNAPTGISLPVPAIEALLKTLTKGILIVDEAYVDFGGESAVPLIESYDNLLVVQTFSKSRSMAGARLGFGMGSPELIRDLKTIQYSTNPYNVNRMTADAGKTALAYGDYYDACCAKIRKTREMTAEGLKKLGFRVLPSCANFLFAESDRIAGEELYLRLKEKGILIRHFTIPRIANFNRITIGLPDDMKTFLAKTEECLEEIK